MSEIKNLIALRQSLDKEYQTLMRELAYHPPNCKCYYEGKADGLAHTLHKIDFLIKKGS